MLLARFYTALWLVNATTLPLEAAALPTAPPPRADASLLDAADGMKLRVIETRTSDGWAYCFHNTYFSASSLFTMAIFEPRKESTPQNLLEGSQVTKYRLSNVGLLGLGSACHNHLCLETVKVTHGAAGDLRTQWQLLPAAWC